jgi:hypothetical protein
MTYNALSVTGREANTPTPVRRQFPPQQPVRGVLPVSDCTLQAIQERIGRTRAVSLAPQLPIRQTLCHLEHPVRPFCGIRLADHRPRLLVWDEILQAFATAAIGRSVRVAASFPTANAVH